MKTLIIFLFVFSVGAYAQYPIWQTLPGEGTFFSTGETTTAKTFHPIGIKDFPDTVKVIMLVLDTSLGYFGFVDQLDIRTFRYPICVYGYIVTGVETMPIAHVEVPVATKKEYLDENKKPFQKSIIIWMSKEIKQ